MAVKSFNLPQYRPMGVRAPLTIAISQLFGMETRKSMQQLVETQ
jgi:hypothetical protein